MRLAVKLPENGVLKTKGRRVTNPLNLIKRCYWNLSKGSWNYAEAVAFLVPGRAGDWLFARIRYKKIFKFTPAIHRPRRLSEHLQSLKVSRDGRSQLRRLITDKELVKDFIHKRLGAEKAAKTIAVIHSIDELRAYEFPANCVVKATHDSGSVLIRKNYSQVNLKKIEGWFSRNYYLELREPNYKRLVPKVIVEELLVEDGQDVPRDYKVFCFHGVTAFIQVDGDRFTGHCRSFYSTSWNELNLSMNFPQMLVKAERPIGLDEMLDCARKLSSGFSFLRVDFFQVTGGVVIGELTNIPEAGFTKFSPDDADLKAGSFFSNPNADPEALFGIRG